MLIAAGPAHAVKLYKWVDENGSTHYHQGPPPKGVQFVEEKDFDGETNVVPSPETEAAMNAPAEETPGPSSGGPATGQDDGQRQADEPSEQKALTPEELTAIAKEGARQPDLPIEAPGPGGESAGGGESATGAAGASSGASGAGAGTAAGAAPAVIPPLVPPAVVPGP